MTKKLQSRQKSVEVAKRIVASRRSKRRSSSKMLKTRGAKFREGIPSRIPHILSIRIPNILENSIRGYHKVGESDFL